MMDSPTYGRQLLKTLLFLTVLFPLLVGPTVYYFWSFIGCLFSFVTSCILGAIFVRRKKVLEGISGGLLGGLMIGVFPAFFIRIGMRGLLQETGILLAISFSFAMLLGVGGVKSERVFPHHQTISSLLRALSHYGLLLSVLFIATLLANLRQLQVFSEDAIVWAIKSGFASGFAVVISLYFGFRLGELIGSRLVESLRFWSEVRPYLRRATAPFCAFFIGYMAIILAFGSWYAVLDKWQECKAIKIGSEYKCVDYLDAVYFSVLTGTTLGYSDLTPASKTAKVFTGLETIVVLAWTIGVLAAVVARYQDTLKDIITGT